MLIFKLPLIPRLGVWLMTSLLLLGLIGLLSPQQLPVVLYKLSLVTLSAVLGYWLDRSLFPKARPGQYLHYDHQFMQKGQYPVAHNCQFAFAASLLRRAIIVAAVCLSVAMGL